jgi:hypothetical protein
VGYIQGMADLSSMRVADEEREQLIDELREHAGAGRLTSEELEGRRHRYRGLPRL